MSKEEWVTVEIPEGTVQKLENLRKTKYERRPGNVPLRLFIDDMIKASLEREEMQASYPPLLEEYLVETDAIFIKDNRTSKVVELSFKEGDLYCPVDAAKNCVHVGFAWSIPRANRMLNLHKTKPK